ncbi:MAG: right-handed parallel beta-helix repeat-containing protein, partial [Methanobrevibacter sp.]
MIKKINIFLVLLLLLLSIGVVSATADADNSIMSNNETISDSVTSDSDEILSSDVTDDELVTASSHVVTSSNYNNYFNKKLEDTEYVYSLIPSAVNEGDTLEFDGSFKDMKFTFGMALNIVGTSTNDMKNCGFVFSNGASGSTVSNLKIANTIDYKYGIFLNNANNCVIRDCLINNTGASSYTICVANGAMYNNVSNNVLNTYGQTYGHGTRSTPAILLSGSHYNYIGDNVISCDDANAIYLSSFEGGPIKGGLSNFNTIHNNMITYNVLPTSWAYGIQVMGGNNTISSNRIYGAYRGISTSAPGNVIVDNWIINLTGADYNNPGVPSGGEIAIVGSYHSTIKNNHIVNARVMSTGSGISVLDNSTVENNFVEVSLQGKGIYPQGSNIKIKDNTIITDSGSGILYNTYAYNLEVL